MNEGEIGISWPRVVFAFAVVFALIALMGYALKYIKLRGFAGPLSGTGTRRLQILETLPLDPRRRLVLIKRDEAEHLLLLGANEDVVVEANLVKTPGGVPTKIGT